VSTPAPKYLLATYGCQMNEYDSNMVASMLDKRGMSLTENPDEADLFVVNTCSIRGGAEDKAYARVAALRHHKRTRPGVRIAVIGCMAQNHGEKIPTALEHVDYVVGPDGYGALEGMIFGENEDEPAKGRSSRGQAGGKHGEAGAVVWTEQNDFENYEGMVARLDGSVSAHVTIMRGCNKRCTYCIVPNVRGVERSRSADEVIAEVRQVVAQGVTEVCLLGQTVNSYRDVSRAARGTPATVSFESEDLDLEQAARSVELPVGTPDNGGVVTFAQLLRRLNEIEGLRRIRFTSPHPRHFDSATIRAIAECDKICKHVHMPLQSGSNSLLKKMRRQYTRERFLEIVQELRAAIPDVSITTDIITGFVGETEQDYADTLSLMEAVRFDHAFMFSYSPREGTPSYLESETLTPEEKQARLEGVIGLQMRLTEERLDSMVGRTEEILIEGPSSRTDTEWMGKTDGFKKVIVPFAPGVEKGAYVRARVVERRGLILRGVVEPQGDGQSA
jgi:tRNA-2-methylthio-N6-dimethylallyladenosine synthase